MNLSDTNVTTITNRQDADIITSDKVLAKMNYLNAILSEIKRKSVGIRLLIEKLAQTIACYQQNGEIITKMINLFASLDSVYRSPEECMNREVLTMAITVALEVMKLVGAEEIITHKGDIFDCRIHRIIGVENLDLPDGTILEVIYRGFKVGDKIYPTHVLVAKELKRNDPADSKQQAHNNGSKHSKLTIPDHASYHKSVREAFARLSGDPVAMNWIYEYHEQLLAVFTIDFDPIIPKIKSIFSPDRRGHPPCDPIAVMRSLLLMSLFKQTSIPFWVSTIKTDPLLAIVAGFQPRKTACVGTYYNLFQKLENGPYHPKCCHRVLASDIRKARSHFRFPKEKPKDEEKNKPVERDVLQKLVEQLGREADEPIPNDVERLMDEILCELAVKPSAAKGLLGDITKLVVCSDGSTVPSGASPHGKSTCDCHKKGIYRCEHLRKFSDIDSDWGWDNREKDWVFGNRYYQFVCCEKKHDLPFYLSMQAASTHEAVMSLKGLERLRKQAETIFPEMKLKYLSGDSIHDAYAYYGYLISHEILYAIPYANQPPKCIDVNGKGIFFNEMGVPLCLGGLPE